MSSKQSEQIESPSVQKLELSEQTDGDGVGKALLGNNFGLIRDVKVALFATLGSSEMTVKELFSLKKDSLLKLDRLTTDPIDIVLDGKVVARGDLVAVEDSFGVRITQILNDTVPLG